MLLAVVLSQSSVELRVEDTLSVDKVASIADDAEDKVSIVVSIECLCVRVVLAEWEVCLVAIFVSCV